MNKARRKALSDIIDLLEELKSCVEELQQEEEEYRECPKTCRTANATKSQTMLAAICTTMSAA